MAEVAAQAHQSERALAIVTHEGWVALRLQPGRWEERYCVLQPLDGLYLFQNEADASDWLTSKEELLEQQLRPPNPAIDDLAIEAAALAPKVIQTLSEEANQVTDGDYSSAFVANIKGKGINDRDTVLAVVSDDCDEWIEACTCARVISAYVAHCAQLNTPPIPTILHDVFTDFPKLPSLVRLAVTPRNASSADKLPKGFQPSEITEKSARALATYLHELGDQAKLVIFDRTRLSDDTVALLLPGLSACQSVIGLSAERNAISNAGAGFLSQALYATGGLKTIHLSRNRIGDIGAVHLANLIVCKPTLLSVRLAWNNIGPNGARAIGHAVERSMLLQDLDMSHNPLGSNGFNSTVLALTGALALRTINLSHCGAGDESIDILLDSITKHKKRAFDKGLEGIWLDGNRFSINGIQRIKTELSSLAPQLFVSVEPQAPDAEPQTSQPRDVELEQTQQTPMKPTQFSSDATAVSENYPRNGARNRKVRREKPLTIAVPSPPPYSPEIDRTSTSKSELKNQHSLLRLEFENSSSKPNASKLSKSIAIFLGLPTNRVIVSGESDRKVELAISRDHDATIAKLFVSKHKQKDPKLALFRIMSCMIVGHPATCTKSNHVASIGPSRLSPQLELQEERIKSHGREYINDSRSTHSNLASGLLDSSSVDMHSTSSRRSSARLSVETASSAGVPIPPIDSSLRHVRDTNEINRTRSNTVDSFQSQSSGTASSIHSLNHSLRSESANGFHKPSLSLNMGIVNRSTMSTTSSYHDAQSTQSAKALSHLPSTRIAVSGESYFDGPSNAKVPREKLDNMESIAHELKEGVSTVLWTPESTDSIRGGMNHGQATLPPIVQQACKQVARSLAALGLTVPALHSIREDSPAAAATAGKPGTMEWTQARYREHNTLLGRHTPTNGAANKPGTPFMTVPPATASALTVLTQYLQPEVNFLRLFAFAMAGNQDDCLKLANHLSLGSPPLNSKQHVQLLEALTIAACVSGSLPDLESILERYRVLTGTVAISEGKPVHSDLLAVGKLYLRMAYEVLAEEQLLAVRLEPSRQVCERVRMDASAWELTEFKHLSASPHLVLHYQTVRHGPLTVYVHSSNVQDNANIGLFVKAHANASKKIFNSLTQAMAVSSQHTTSRKFQPETDGARVAAAHEAVGIAIGNRGSVDELFCQLACQLIGTPTVESQCIGWRLFIGAARILVPSPDLALCLIRLCGRLLRNCSEKSVKPLIHWAIHEMKRTQMDPEREVLSNGCTMFAKDVDLRFTILRDILCDVPCATDVQLPGGAIVKCEVRCLMSFSQLLHHIDARLLHGSTASPLGASKPEEQFNGSSTLLNHQASSQQHEGNTRKASLLHLNWEGYRFMSISNSCPKPMEWQDDVYWFVWCNNIVHTKPDHIGPRHKTVLTLELEVAPIPTWSLCRLNAPELRTTLMFRQQHKLFLDGMMCISDPQVVGYLAVLSTCIDMGVDRYRELPRRSRFRDVEKNVPRDVLVTVGYNEPENLLNHDRVAFVRVMRETVDLVDKAILRVSKERTTNEMLNGSQYAFNKEQHRLKVAYLAISSSLPLGFARFFSVTILSMALGGTKVKRGLLPKDVCLSVNKHGLALLTMESRSVIWAASFESITAIDAVNNVLRIQVCNAEDSSIVEDLISLRHPFANGVHQTVMRHCQAVLTQGAASSMTNPDLYFLEFNYSFPDLPLPPCTPALSTPSGNPVLAWPVTKRESEHNGGLGEFNEVEAMNVAAVASTLAKEWPKEPTVLLKNSIAPPRDRKESWMIRTGASVVQNIVDPLEGGYVSTSKLWEQTAPLPPTYPPPSHSPQVDLTATGLNLKISSRHDDDNSSNGFVLQEVSPPPETIISTQPMLGEDHNKPPVKLKSVDDNSTSSSCDESEVQIERNGNPIQFIPSPPFVPPPPQHQPPGVTAKPNEIGVSVRPPVPPAGPPPTIEPTETGTTNSVQETTSQGKPPAPPIVPPPPACPPPEVEREFGRPPGPSGRKRPSVSRFNKQNSEHAEYFKNVQQ